MGVDCWPASTAKSRQEVQFETPATALALSGLSLVLTRRSELSSLAIHLALRLVALDPLRERSQVALMQAYLAEGSFGRAERQHRAFCELLESSFGRGYARPFVDVLAAR